MAWMAVAADSITAFSARIKSNSQPSADCDERDITDFDLSGYSLPGRIVTRPDGNLWFTNWGKRAQPPVHRQDPGPAGAANEAQAQEAAPLP